MLVRTGMLVTGISVPTITTFTLSSPTKASGCAPVAMSATWTIANEDNASYKLVIQETGTIFNCASVVGTTVYTLETYDDGTTSNITPTLTLQMVRRSDNAVMSSASATCSSSIWVGPAC